MDGIFSLSSDEFSLTAVAFAIALEQGLTADQKDVMGNFFSLVGQYLSTSASQQNNLDKKS